MGTAGSYLVFLSVTSHVLGKFLIDPLWFPMSGPWEPVDGSTCKMNWVACESWVEPHTGQSQQLGGRG